MHDGGPYVGAHISGRADCIKFYPHTSSHNGRKAGAAGTVAGKCCWNFPTCGITSSATKRTKYLNMQTDLTGMRMYRMRACLHMLYTILNTIALCCVAFYQQKQANNSINLSSTSVYTYTRPCGVVYARVHVIL